MTNQLPAQYIKPLARMGYAARGLIYTVIAIFAIRAGLWSGQSTDTKGAIATIIQTPFGEALVIALLAGLAGYVMWRLIQSILDTDNHGLEPAGAAVRAGLLASAATYSTLFVYTLSAAGYLSGSPSSGNSSSLADTLARFIGNQWAALLLGAIFLGVAGAHFWKAWKEKYRDHIQASAAKMPFIDIISKTGLAARGMVLIVIAILFFKRATQAGGHSGEPGLAAALEYIRSMPGGELLLVCIGFGLLAFAGYSFAEARWRRINVEDA